MLAPGTVLQNRYQIIAQLGVGGMGAVYLVQDLRLGQVVALKENLSGDPHQFQQEAVLLANLRHPNLPRVIDHFIEPNGTQYLVMDYIEGEDLETRLARQGALPKAQVLAWFDQILDAVAYLHSRGVIHRDIKPANIKITPTGQAVLVDFGIAKVYRPGRPTLTGAKAVTPGFAAPEQYHGGTDQRSDVYSLGATLYALLVGGVPPDALALEKGTATLVPPRMLNPTLSVQTEQAILRAMAVSPQQRFQSADEMQRALKQVTKSVPVPPPKAPVFAMLGIVGVLLMFGAGGIVWWTSSQILTPLPKTTTSTAMFISKPTATPSFTPSPTTTPTATATFISKPTATPSFTPSPTTMPRATATWTATPILAPAINHFSANSTTVTRGTAVLLNWSVSNADIVFLNGDKVEPSGTRLVSPTTTTTYQLIANNAGGTTDKAITIVVQQPTFTPPPPTPSGPTGEIAFHSSRNGNWEIYVMNANGTNLRNLTSSPGNDIDPAWSSDGRLIVFHSNRNGNDEIYLMNSDGTNPRRLTNHPAADRNPALSPDGRLIAFDSNRDGNLQIYVMNTDGTGLRRLTNNRAKDWGAAWSPDSRFILFNSDRDGNEEIYVMNADGTNQRNLTNHPAADGSPAWSPDGRLIAFHSNRDGNDEIYVMNTEGTNVHCLTNHPADDWGPTWSPDSRFIAFVSTRDGNEEIYAMNADGTNQRNLTNHPADDGSPMWSLR